MTPRLSWSWILLLAAAAYGIVQCVDLLWACDDAYISFRYARNLVEGHGLIFNPGSPEEHVEGYTNFSWTMLLALGLALGVPELAVDTWAALLGLACWSGTVGVLLAASRSIGRAAGTGAVPVAATGLCLHHHHASLAVGGLETGLFALLVTGLLCGTVVARSARHWAGLGILAGLAVLTRPDGALAAAAAFGFAIAGARRRGGRIVVAYVLAAAVLLVPHQVFRLVYYGAWVPNTFHAKSASEPYLDQGLKYAAWYFGVYWILVPALLLVLWGAVRPGGGRGEGWAGPRGGRVLAAFVLPYLAFVAWVGGDFMFARFLLPVTPALYLAWERLRCRHPGIGAGLGLQLTVGLGTLLMWWPEVLDHYERRVNPHGFSDNRAISFAPIHPASRKTRVEASREAGLMARELTRGLDFRVALHGGHANLAYYGDFPVAIETASGLTDRHIATLPVGDRGMVGHERRHGEFVDYLQEREVDVTFHLAWEAGDAVDDVRVAGWEGLPGRGWPLRRIVLRHPDHPGVALPGRIVVYRRENMEALRERSPGTAFVPFEQWLDEVYLPGIDGKDRSEVERDWRAFRAYYFDHNDDPGRAARIRAALER